MTVSENQNLRMGLFRVHYLGLVGFGDLFMRSTSSKGLGFKVWKFGGPVCEEDVQLGFRIWGLVLGGLGHLFVKRTSSNQHKRR